MKTKTRQGWKRLLAAVALASGLWPAAVSEAGHEDGKILIFAQPLAGADAIWMAQAKGFFKEQKLDVAVRWRSSGNGALRTFEGGQDRTQGFGDFMILNELQAVNFWQDMEGKFAVVAALARDAEGHVAITRSEFKNPQALKAKAVATQLASTSAWFLGEYLRAHGMSELDVAVKGMSSEVILEWDVDGGDVAAFFVREPYGTRALAKYGSRVHRLTSAKGYMHGYLLLGTWQWYLRDHPGVAERLLMALDKGRKYAMAHKDEVIQFARGMFSIEDTTQVEMDYASNDRVVGLDWVTLDEFHKLGRWMKEAGLLKKKFGLAAFFDPRPLRAGLPERLAPEFHQQGERR